MKLYIKGYIVTVILVIVTVIVSKSPYWVKKVWKVIGKKGLWLGNRDHYA